MPLVKNNAAARLSQSAVVLDLGDLRGQADRIIADAHAEAERIINESRAQAQLLIEAADARGHEAGMARGLEEGREQGRTEGREEARAACEEEYRLLAENWAKAVEHWEEEFGSMLQMAREDVLVFAFAMGRKIALRTIEMDPSVVQTQVAEALTYLSHPSTVTVVVHPDDAALVEHVLPELIDRIDGCKFTRIDPDDAIGRGGCIIRTARGRIDATIEKQIERIAATLLPDRTMPPEPEEEAAP